MKHIYEISQFEITLELSRVCTFSSRPYLLLKNPLVRIPLQKVEVVRSRLTAAWYFVNLQLHHTEVEFIIASTIRLSEKLGLEHFLSDL